MITILVFDMDDTLYDEIDYCRSGFKAVSVFLADQQPNLPAETAFNALWQQFTSGNHTKTFNTALDQLNIKYETPLITSLVNVYRNHKPEITLPESSRQALEQLTQKYQLALLTDGFLPAQQLKVQALDIRKYFKAVVYTEQLGREFWKPSPAGFEKLITDLRANPKNMAYIADNEKKDFIAPNELGFLTIQLIRPNRLHCEKADNPNATPKHIIRDICQLEPILSQS
jgi:putative hydrolase of the HAD superfamily